MPKQNRSPYHGDLAEPLRRRKQIDQIDPEWEAELGRPLKSLVLIFAGEQAGFTGDETEPLWCAGTTARQVT